MKKDVNEHKKGFMAPILIRNAATALALCKAQVPMLADKDIGQRCSAVAARTGGGALHVIARAPACRKMKFSIAR